MRNALVGFAFAALLGCSGSSSHGTTPAAGGPTGPGPAPAAAYTCQDMVKHDAELTGTQPQDERVKMCEEHHPSQEALACFVRSADHDAFMACGKKFFPND